MGFGGMWQIKAVFAVVVFGAFIGTDFVIGNNARPDGEKLSFGAYLAGWADKVRGAAPEAEEGPLLAEYLPAAGNGWKRSEVDDKDVPRMLVREARDVLDGGGGLPGEDARSLAAVGAPREDAQMAAFTYVRERDRIVVELARYPDAVFTDTARAVEKAALVGWVAEEGVEPIGTLTGMQVWEARISPGLGARLAIASVGGQVQLRVVHPEKLAAAEVMALLQGLDVVALNGMVVEPDSVIVAAVAKAKEEGQGAPSSLLAAPMALWSALTGKGDAAEAPAEDVAAVEEKPAPTVLDVAEKRGGKSDITLGVGNCDSRSGGKFCSVGE